MSTRPDFLRRTHDTFRDTIETLPPVDLDLDTTDLSADAVADRIFG